MTSYRAKKIAITCLVTPLICFAIPRLAEAQPTDRNAVQNPAANSEKPTETKVNPVDGAEMVFVPAGEFLMGDDDTDEIKKDNPRHTVKLSGFWMYKNLVTVAQYKLYCKKTGKVMPPAPDFDPQWSQDDHPVVHVTWAAARDYAKWANADLPTEAQWEKAARGTAGRKYPWGDQFDASQLWCSKNPLFHAKGTHQVGELGVSPYGCTDMAGNVWQWCKDWYREDFWKGASASQPDPENQFYVLPWRVLRGGSWGGFNGAGYFYSAYRSIQSNELEPDEIGFRCSIRPTE